MEILVDGSDSKTVSKKRNLSQISGSSVSPSPAPKMTHFKDQDSFCEDLELNQPSLSRLVELQASSSTDTDTAALHSKMDTVIDLLQSLMKAFEINKHSTRTDIDSLRTENDWLKLKLKESEGRVTRISTDMQKLHVKCEDLQLRSMSTNFVIYNVPEQPQENIYDVVLNLMSTKLKIPDNLIHSHRYPAAPLQIDIAHRMGKQGTRPRLIVVKLVTQRGKDLVFSHVKNLKGTNISIAEQLPSEMRERRDAQFQSFKDLRNQHKGNSSVKVRLLKDKLLVNGEIVPDQFELQPLSPDGQQSVAFEYNSVIHTDVIEASGSFFQGHLKEVSCVAEAKAAYSALLQDPNVAKAHHIVYAYAVEEKEEELLGYSDDGEYRASKILCEVLKNKKLKNVFLAVSRIHNGPNLGKKRFELIQIAAERVAEMTK